MAYNKYKNRKFVYDGMKFDSRGEANRWQELTLLAAANIIHQLVRQVRIPIEVNGVKVCDYIADFAYKEGAVQVVEDFKGYKTDIYKLKKKLFCAINPHITFRESFAPKKTTRRRKKV